MAESKPLPTVFMDQNQEKSWMPSPAELPGEKPSGLTLTGLSGPERAYALDRIYRQRPAAMLVVLPSVRDAETFLEDLLFFGASAPLPAGLFPGYNLLPFKSLSYHSETAAQRTRAL